VPTPIPWSGLLEGVRRAIEAAENHWGDRTLLEGAAFAIESEALRLPPEDRLRASLFAAAELVRSASRRTDESRLEMLRTAEELLLNRAAACAKTGRSGQ
jgi:hypothetical protein